MNVARGFCLALAIAIGSIGAGGAEEWIMGTALTDDHEVIDNTCADNFFGNTWKTNKYGSINGFGTLSSDGTNCYTKNRKDNDVTRSGRTAYWTLVEDRLDAASYSPELNYPILEGGVIDVENDLGVSADGELYTLADEVDDSGSSYTQADIDAAVEAALADEIDDLVTSEELVEVQDRLGALE